MVEVALSRMDGEPEGRTEREDDLPPEFGCQAADLSNCPQMKSSRCSEVPLLSFSATSFCHSSACLISSSAHLLLEPGVQGLYGYRIGRRRGPKSNFLGTNTEMLVPLRSMGLQA